MKMKNWVQRLCALGMAVALCAVLVACGSSGSAMMESAPSYDSSNEITGSYGSDAQAQATTDVGGGESTLLPEGPSAQSNRKIVYSATMRVETTTFETARTAIMDAVEDCGGYIAYSDISGTAEDGSRRASYSVRVPVDNYSKFVAAAGQAGNVDSLTENAEDITSNYIDVQARLSALEAQRDRLNELAENAETTADLIEIEGRISDVQYELENYTQQMRAMDDQITYSTVELYLNEVTVVTPAARTAFGDRAAAAFFAGIDSFTTGIQWLALAIIYLLPLLAIIAIIVIIILATRPARQKRRAAKAARNASRMAANPAPGYYPGPNATPMQNGGATYTAPNAPASPATGTPPSSTTPADKTDKK